MHLREVVVITAAAVAAAVNATNVVKLAILLDTALKMLETAVAVVDMTEMILAGPATLAVGKGIWLETVIRVRNATIAEVWDI